MGVRGPRESKGDEKEEEATYSCKFTAVVHELLTDIFRSPQQMKL